MPTVLNPHRKTTLAKAGIAKPCPLRERERDAASGHPVIVPSVIGLNTGKRPTAIFRRVVPVIVDPVNRVNHSGAAPCHLQTTRRNPTAYTLKFRGQRIHAYGGNASACFSMSDTGRGGLQLSG